MHVKTLPHWKWKNLASESSLASENSGTEANNDWKSEIEDTDDVNMDASSPLGMWFLTRNVCICNVDSVNFNMYCVLSLRVNYIFSFRCSDVDAMGGGLKGINSDKIK